MVQHQTHLVQGRIDTVRKEEEEEEEAGSPFVLLATKDTLAGLMGCVCVVMVPDSGFHHQSGRPAHY